MTPPRWLRLLERRLEDGGADALAEALVLLAVAAAEAVELRPDEAHGACRRALLLLATGGDPRRGLDLHGRAVGALADDLDAPARRDALALGLASIGEQAAGLLLVGELVRELRADPDIAWRAYAAGVLAEALESD